MDVIDREAIAGLAAYEGFPAVSLYLPVHRETTANEGDRIRLKNLLRSAADGLYAEGLRRPDAEAFLAAASGLAVDGLWSGGFQGLAVLVGGGSTRTLRLADPVPERWLVGDRFYLRPLLPAWKRDVGFWALALDRNETRLYKGDRTKLLRIDLPEGIPASFADETRYDLREQSLQYRSLAAAGSPGRGVALFHGHGGEKDADKVELLQYVLHLENGVTSLATGEGSDPLVLLGTEQMTAAYRDVSAYAPVYIAEPLGATDQLSEREVHAAVLRVLEAREAAMVSDEIARLEEKEAAGLASRDPSVIVSAAAAGRVATLYADDGSGPWGVLDAATLEASGVRESAPARLRAHVAAAEVPEECGWDLVDLAAVQTLLHGGAVRAFAGPDAPVVGAAAIFRY